MFTEQNSVKINSNSFAIENLNYELLKLFQLSILWRLIVSNENKFPNINMDSQEQKLRTLILKDDPGEPEDFGCYMSLILFENGIMDGIITPAEHININSNDYIRIVFGGFIWLFTLIEKNHSSLRKYFINKEGKIIIDIKQAEKLGFLIKYAKDLQKSGNLDD